MLCEACGTCAATKTWVDDRHRVPERHRLCTTCHDLVIEERRTAMGSSKRDPDNAKIANAILRALADSDGLSQQQIRIAINAEPDEYRTINGILTSLGKRGEVSTVSGRYLLTPKGRRQLEPDASPPPVTSPGKVSVAPVQAIEPAVMGRLWDALAYVGRLAGSDTDAIEVAARTLIALSPAELPNVSADLRAAIERVGIQGRELSDRVDLLVAAREAIEVVEGRQAKAEEARLSIIETAKDGEGMQEQLSREVSDLITALRAIEAALPGGPSGLRADAIADRTVALLSVAPTSEKTEARLQAFAVATENLVAERAAHDETRAEVERLKADLDKVNDESTALRAEVDTLRRAAPITGWGNAQTVELAIDVSRERAAAEARLADAEAEIAELRGENAALRATAATDTDGHYWTEQGGRHVLAILRPVEIAAINVLDTGRSLYWEAGPHSGRVDASSPEALDLAQRLAEVAAGVRS